MLALDNKLKLNFFYKLRNMVVLCILAFAPYSCLSAETFHVKLSQVIQEAEKLQREDLLSAIKLLKTYEQKCVESSIEEQIKFRKLQAELYNQKTDYQDGKKSAEEGISLTKQLARPSIIMADLLNLRGFAIESLGDFDSALEDYMSALEISESLNNNKAVIQSLTNIGAIYYITTQFKRSLIILNDALSLAQNFGDEELLGTVQSELGALYTYLRQENKAKDFFESSYQHLINANRPYKALVTLQNIAINHSENKRYNQAITLYKQIIVKAKKFDNYSAIANTYSVMASAYLNKTKSDPHTAYHYILIAEKYFKSVDSINFKMVFLLNKADVLNHLNRYEESLETLALADELMPSQANFLKTYAFPETLRIKSELYFKLGLYKKAYDTQKSFHENTLKINEIYNTQAIEGLRVQFESEQHVIQSNVLEKRKFVQSLALRDVNKQHKNINFYIVIGVILILGLAWFYVVNLKHQKRLLNSRETDHLTDLPNRQTILPKGLSDFNKAHKNKKYYSVLLIQIDNFKKINQVKGYDTGNNILIEISLILSSAINKEATCGKYSSNEFIVLLPEYNEQQTEKLAEQIHNHVYNKSWDKYGLKVVSVSIGGAINNSQQITSFEELVKRAIRLKNQAINVGGNSICV